MRATLLLLVLVGAPLGAQAADDVERRIAAVEAQHTDARLAVLEATVADLKKTTREDTLWIRGIIAAGVGVTGVGVVKLRKRANGVTHP